MSARKESYSNFSGNGLFGTKNISQPYVLQISNSTSATVSSFSIFGASTYLSNPPAGSVWLNGSFTYSGVTVSSALSNVTYQDLLTQTMIRPFTVGCTLITVSNNISQAFIPYSINSLDANGNQDSTSINPYLDLYQYQGGVSLADKTPYSIDALTTIVFDRISPNAVFNIYFLPLLIYNQFSENTEAHNKPDIIRTINKQVKQLA